MDAVLPLTLADCERAATNLLPSLEGYCSDLGRLWVFGPKTQVTEISRRIARSYITVVSEDQLIPEFEAHRRLGFPPVAGWYRQQLIKLAAAELVETTFFLTLDADVFAVSPISLAACIHGGRAIRQKDRAEYQTDWLKWAARVLNCRPIDYQPGLTPAILSREAIHRFARWAEARITPASARWRLGAIVAPVCPPLALSSWRGRLLSSLPWTEYCIYDTFLVRENLYDHYHCDPKDTLLVGNNVWIDSDFANWRPRQMDDSGRRLLFNLVQSRTQVSAQTVQNRIAGASSHE